MRQLAMVGIVVLALGTVAFLRDSGFTTREDQVTVGGLTVVATERRAFPSWVAGGIVVVGVVLLAAGLRQRA